MVPDDPSDRLLLACLRAGVEDGPLDPEDEEVSRARRAHLVWSRFADRAKWHRVAGQVLAGLRSTSAAPLAPAEIGRDLEAAYFETLARNLRARGALDGVCAHLARAGVGCLLLKGAALLEIVYPDAGLRPMLDIDLLIPEEDAARAAAVLEGLGYRPAPPFADPGMRAWLWREQARWPPLVAPDDALVVELHRRLGGVDTPLGFEPAGVWDRARPRRARPGRVPAAEDLLVHVALHWLLDRRLRSEGSLGQLADMARVLAGAAGAVDWDVIAREARHHGYGPPLALALGAVEELFRVQMPAGAMAALNPGGTDAAFVTELVRRRVLRSEPWLALERLGPRTTPLRQLLPPRPRRVRSPATDPPPSPPSLLNTYASWSAAATRLLVAAHDVRAEVAFCQRLESLLDRPQLLSG